MRTGPSVFKRADGRWEARYRKGRNKVNNRILYGSVYGSTKEEAIEKRDEMIRMLNAEPDRPIGLEKTDSSFCAGLQTDCADQDANEHRIGNDESESVRDDIIITDSRKGMRKGIKEKVASPLTEEQEAELDAILNTADRGDALPFYLSLHCGVSLNELAVLRWSDLDLGSNVLKISRTTVSRQHRLVSAKYDEPRVVPFTTSARAYLARCPKEDEPNAFVFTRSFHPVTGIQTVYNAFRKLTGDRPDWKDVSPSSLRSSFIRNCLKVNLNTETVSALTGMDRTQLCRSFGQWIQPKIEDISRLDKTDMQSSKAGRHLNLLILGAGSHGHAVLETAEALGVFGEIRFLDDFVQSPEVIGRFEDASRFIERFPCAFIAIGDNGIRKYWAEELKKMGYMFPHLISPDTTVSKHAKVGDGTIIMPQATVSASVIGDYVIVASNALVSYGAELKDYVNLESGAIVTKETTVAEMTKVESGAVYPTPGKSDS